MVSIVGARSFAPDIGHAQRAPTMQGAQKLRSEAPEGPYSSGTAMTKLQRHPAPGGTDGLFTKPSKVQILPAVGTQFWISFVRPAAIKAGGWGSGVPPRRRSSSWLPIPDRQIEGEKDDHDKKNPDRPKKAFPDRIPALLGIEKNPEGRHHGDQKEENLQNSSPKIGSERSRIRGRPGKNGGRRAFFPGPPHPLEPFVPYFLRLS